MNPTKKWTVKQIANWIKEQTKIINDIAMKFVKGEYTDPRYEKEIAKMQKATGQKKTGIGKPVALKLSGKRKKDLITRARKIKNFMKADEEIQVEVRNKEKADNAYKSFVNDNYYVSRDTFDKMRDVFGGLNIKEWNIESDFVSNNVIDKINEGFSTDDIIDAWNEVLSGDQKKGVTSYTLVKRVNKILNKKRKEQKKQEDEE